MSPKKKSNETKSKADLIENIDQGFNNSSQIVKKIVRQTQLFIKDNINNFRETLSKRPKSRFKAD
jgi:hypothetical protein